ncbi:hypothetical protein CYY_001129 [Polysphondylium violaceum]|uniref:Uncharacterized protein n=1 Tax=Polysphondylium violaceum TaxID=133409 RepID=A0A8J4Q0D0_9MYCE|nr:hypothetical protein CYY_001129 [Polysphondylium violaceum]
MFATESVKIVGDISRFKNNADFKSYGLIKNNQVMYEKDFHFNNEDEINQIRNELKRPAVNQTFTINGEKYIIQAQDLLLNFMWAKLANGEKGTLYIRSSNDYKSIFIAHDPHEFYVGTYDKYIEFTNDILTY